MLNPVEEIKNRLDIVELINSYFPLTLAGGNFKARCPFHNEKTASFMVSREKQIWHCFGCSKGGDIIKFVEEYEGLSFKEALRQLAQKANVPLTDFHAPKENNDRIYEANFFAQQFFSDNLHQDSETAKKVNDYLRQRSLSDKIISQWQLGLSGENWDGLINFLRAKNFTEQEIFQAGLSVKKRDGSGYVDRFRKRLMFPIWDASGRVVAFTARTLANIVYREEDLAGKYINSPQTVTYDKSKILYGWHQAKDSIRRQDYLIVVEGNMDTIAAHSAGTTNTVAVSGTALTLDHLKLIKRYTNNIVLSFDGDAAGSRAVFRSITLAWQQEMNIKVIILPAASDPADIVKKDPAAWRKAVKDSVPVMDYYFQRILAGVDLTRADHKKIAVQKLLPIIKNLQSRVEQAHYLQILASKLQLPLHTLEQDLAGAKSIVETQTVNVIRTESKKDQWSILSEKLLTLVFFRTEYLPEMINNIEPELLAPEWQSLYKQAMIYYTKQQHLDNFVDNQDLSESERDDYVRLSLLGEKNYYSIDSRELSNEWQQLQQRLQLYVLGEQRQHLIQELRQAELSNDSNQQDQIAHQINIINHQIQKLQS